ncbi:MAG: prepilin peptidase [Proteobacteria bacterium]|nr:prepilin peptidase [Pseudomonadota bacterium]
MSRVTLLTVPLGCAYKERVEIREDWADKLYRRLRYRVPKISAEHACSPMLAVVNDMSSSLEQMGDEELRERIRRSANELFNRELVPENFASLFAQLREVSARTLQKRHYDVQLVGAAVMLGGNIAEMATGEGKTLTAALAAAAAALVGFPVHVISVNDYLVSRDAEQLEPFFSYLGLSVGTIIEGMDIPARQNAYACDICYCSNKELVFDYLKDRITLQGSPAPIALQLEKIYGSDNRASRLILRGLHFAIVDEADSVLIDEARVPCIISRTVEAEGQAEYTEQAIRLARSLLAEDYLVNRNTGQVRLTDLGRYRLVSIGEEMGGLWQRVQWREESVIQALTALHVYVRDEHYLVEDDKVLIVDEFTGRTMADRSWENGLHQMVEAKESVTITGEREAIAKISYQDFFRRYLHLAGMTGTAADVKDELQTIYRLDVQRVPTNRPLQRQYLPDRFFLTQNEKWLAVTARVKALNANGRPILVGTRSVADSESLSGHFSDAGIAHELLNARQNKDEADVIALAGQAFRVTVATNMAGRGTDIELAKTA